MKKKLSILLIIALLVLSGCESKKENEKSNAKLASEFEYFGSKIFDLSGKINNMSFENYKVVSNKTEIKSEEQSGGSSSGGKGSEGESSGGSSQSGSEGNSQGNSSSGKEGKTIETTEIKPTTSLETKDNEETDWETIKQEIELINSIWCIISVDLSKEKIADNDIQDFNNTLNQTIVNIKNENKNETLENLSNLYSFIPMFMNYVSIENQTKTVTKTKAELLKAYTAVLTDNWENVTNNITNAKNTFIEVLDDKQKMQNVEFKVDKIRMLMQNLENAVKLQDKELFILHYKPLIEQINEIK